MTAPHRFASSFALVSFLGPPFVLSRLSLQGIFSYIFIRFSFLAQLRLFHLIRLHGGADWEHAVSPPASSLPQLHPPVGPQCALLLYVVTFCFSVASGVQFMGLSCLSPLPESHSQSLTPSPSFQLHSLLCHSPPVLPSLVSLPQNFFPFSLSSFPQIYMLRNQKIIPEMESESSEGDLFDFLRSNPEPDDFKFVPNVQRTCPLPVLL